MHSHPNVTYVAFAGRLIVTDGPDCYARQQRPFHTNHHGGRGGWQLLVDVKLADAGVKLTDLGPLALALGLQQRLFRLQSAPH